MQVLNSTFLYNTADTFNGDLGLNSTYVLQNKTGKRRGIMHVKKTIGEIGIKKN